MALGLEMGSWMLYLQTSQGSGLSGPPGLTDKYSVDTVLLVSIDGLVFDILDLIQTKHKAALTWIFEYACSNFHHVTCYCWLYISMVHPTS